MFLIEVVIVLYVIGCIYCLFLTLVIEMAPAVVYILLAPHFVSKVVVGWLQRRLYAEQTEKQELIRELIARVVNATVYGLLAVHFSFSTGWTVFAALTGLSLTTEA